jgi:hypothetical protein
MKKYKIVKILSVYVDFEEYKKHTEERIQYYKDEIIKEKKRHAKKIEKLELSICDLQEQLNEKNH